MKVFIALFALLALALADEWKIKTQEDLVKFRAECVEAKKVPADHVEKFKKWDFPDDETTRCYMQCVFEKMGLFNPDTGFNTEHLVKQLGQDGKENDVRPEIEKCADKNEQKSDSCTWLYRGAKCFMAKNLPLVKKSIEKKNP